MDIHIDRGNKQLNATKGIFVGESSTGEKLVAMSNVSPSDTVELVGHLVQTSMIQIAEDALKSCEEQNRPIPFEELLKEDPTLFPMFKQ